MQFLKGLHHIAIICSDYERSKAFYPHVLEFEITREVFREERSSYKLDLALNGNYLIELFSFPDFKSRPTQPEATGLRHLPFSVENIAESVKYLREFNVVPEPIRTDEFTGRKFTFYRDPDDLPIEVYEELSSN